MTTSSSQIEIGDIEVEVISKDIKNLHIGVYPPDGNVRVSAPLNMTEEAIRLAIVSKLRWIRRHKNDFSKYFRESKREMVSGESHYFEGNRYLLEVTEENKPPSVSIGNMKYLFLRVRPGSGPEKRLEILNKWYRTKLRARLDEMIPKLETKIGVDINFYGIKRMKTRWGSCNPGTRRIWLNLELAKRPPACLEYIIIHEMLHLIERHHNDKFFELLDKFMPNWRIHRDTLDVPPLVYMGS